MKIKFYNTAFAMLIVCIGTYVEAQVPVWSTGLGDGNFTSFSTEKTYNDLTLLKAITPPAYYNNPDFGVRVNDKTDWYEQIDKRTLKTRTYKGVGNQVIVESAYDNINYTDANGWLRAVNTKLTPSSNGWFAEQQETPVYLYKDASTALSLGRSNVMLFNKNVQFNGESISTNNYTVGDNGMYIKNTIANTDKIIRFGRGAIETDYKINQPLELNNDLIISEDIILPAGYTISENDGYNTEADRPGSLVVKGSDGKVAAILNAPYCYDNDRESIIGTYQLQKQDNGYRLKVVVPSAWLNASTRQYPVTIDPMVTGPISTWSGSPIPGCLFPNYGSGTMAVFVPADITITLFYIQAGFYTPTLKGNQGEINLVTSCDSTGWLVDNADTMTGFPVISGNFLALDPLTSCIAPSCSIQQFNLTEEISRSAGNNDCDTTELYYSTYWGNYYNYPFEAYVVGYTVQDSSWSVTPNPVCEDNCNLTLKVAADYGVPPYIISHPWSAIQDTVGRYDSVSAESFGNAVITLTIPNCPDNATGTLYVPPPSIIDACGDTVSGLTVLSIPISSAPNVPSIHRTGDVFISSATEGNQWNLNGNPIPGATYENDTTNFSGCYSVTAENVANGCSTTSDTLCITTGIATISGQNNNITIYPNPTNNLTTVEFIASEQHVQLNLINVLGQIVYSQVLVPVNGNSYRTNLNLLQLPAGIYEVVITTPSQSVAKEVIKQ